MITVSDVTDGTGDRVTEDAWKGQPSATMNCQHEWPIQPSPPKAFWDTWQRALRSMCGRNRVLVQKLGRWTPAGSETAVWWFCPRGESLFQRTKSSTVTFTIRSARRTRNSALRFRIDSSTPATIPATARPCTTSIQGNDVLIQGYSDCVPTPPTRIVPLTFTDYLASLEDKAWVFSSIQIRGSMEIVAAAIRKGTCSCVTDGSYKDGHGTAAWKISDVETPEHYIEGQCVTPGSSVQQNAYRSELSGLYASVMATNALVSFFSISAGSMTLACDNLGAIKTMSYHADHTSPTGAHFDLVMAIQYAKSPNIQWNHQHVMGHQDDVEDHILSLLELINVEMDNKAKAHWENTRQIEEHQRQHYFAAEPWSISLADTKIVTDLATTVQDWCQKPRIHGKWIEKGRVPADELNHIDYTTTEQAMRSVEPTVRRWITKHTSGFCGANKWMHRWKWRDSAKCPQCEEPIEDADHVWLCQGAESPE
jgi:hypothetical protein